MRFNVNPDKYLFSIGIVLIGFVTIISYIIAANNYFMLIGLSIWTILSFFIIRQVNVKLCITINTFVFVKKAKRIIIKYEEVICIKQISNYSNPLHCDKYIIVSNNAVASKIEIQNRSFSKWIKKNECNFKIVKSYTID